MIIADKLSVVSSSKGVLPRRIKDLFDLYFICSMFDINYEFICETMKNNGRPLGDFTVPKGYQDQSKSGLYHAYLSYTGIMNKPDFIALVNKAFAFGEPFAKNYKGPLTWNKDRGGWV